MIKRAFRPVAIMLSLLLVAAVPAQAGPVTLADVVQVISGSQRYGGQAPIMQLRTATQEDKTQKSNPNSTASSSQQQQQGGGDASTQQDPPVSSSDPQVQAQTEEVTEIAVGDCECGELPDEIVEIPGRRNFLPFIPLVGLICVTGICFPDSTPTPTMPTPTPPNPPIPEPATLLLFGSGLAALGAGARRRYARIKLAQQANTTEG